MGSISPAIILASNPLILSARRLSQDLTVKFAMLPCWLEGLGCLLASAWREPVVDSNRFSLWLMPRKSTTILSGSVVWAAAWWNLQEEEEEEQSAGDAVSGLAVGERCEDNGLRSECVTVLRTWAST
ncbi:unnamed protein product [Arctogadus glacialis]